ncbi:TIGR02466 family protein [Sphingomonas sp.]|uniref:TIGR02466 family protein n=1 Tax=Sphingomonas sp. TaxID=28214 RepID=UPI001E010F26|nr:TIGR02466 family protein [Sphingomonas sp.]MBX9795885.1 2OG-Fe(II) oxygenase family protein [Sphingomonas sp.]
MTGAPRQIFGTPLIVTELPGADAINPALEALILDARARDTGVVRSNAGGWHSDTQFLRWAGDAIVPVARAMIAAADAATEDLQAQPGMRRGWMMEGWANVNPPGGAHNVPHSHGGSYWSAVYYVRVDAGEGGALVFHDPRSPMIEMHAPMLRFRGGNGEQQLSVQPRAGQLILFPAWLVHSVTPWQGEGLRISIAVNLSANTKLQPVA